MLQFGISFRFCANGAVADAIEPANASLSSMKIMKIFEILKILTATNAPTSTTWISKSATSSETTLWVPHHHMDSAASMGPAAWDPPPIQQPLVPIPHRSKHTACPFFI
ncbi:hypothetical protein JCM33374_g6685 [Metschnikowia sp. JCM 33374]|nr:hypothetical protein JCM33374_g6685 [Metschnikowia sp. JCM 33374]